MIWTVCFFSAIAILTVTVIMTVYASKHKRGSFFEKPINLLFAGVALAAAVVFIPIYSGFGYKGGLLTTLLLSIHNTLRLFIIDGELIFVLERMIGTPEWLCVPYFTLAALLFLAAPMITFGFVLSFNKNLAAANKYLRGFKKELYVFSHLNGKTAALGEYVAGQGGKKLFVYCNAEETGSEALLDRAKALNAVFFKKGTDAVKLNLHSRKSGIRIFELGENESENVDRAIAIAEKYGDRANMHLYAASAEPKAEALLSHFSEKGLHMHRINEARAFLYNQLYEKGQVLFEEAAQGDGFRQIGALIVGRGQYGHELLKALPWFCQMDGYRVRIRAISDDPNAKARFTAECPELMDGAHNGNSADDGEAQYLIGVTDGVDLDSDAFIREIEAFTSVTFVFVDTGSDAKNIGTALRLRTQFERMHIRPRIRAVLNDPEEAQMLESMCSYSGDGYGIDFVCSIKTLYDEGGVINSELEQEALRRHMKWGEEKKFWAYEYNYRSSMASVIHSRMKRFCNIPGADKPPEQRSEEEKLALRKLEHRRWNAYMRSEGFVYSGSTEKSSRNNLGKLHNCLVTFDLLSPEDQVKDDN